MEPILAWRRPAAVVALVTLTVEVAWRAVALGAGLAGPGQPGVSLFYSLPTATPAALVLLLAVGMLTGSCCRSPAVQGCRTLVRWAVALAGVSMLIGLVGVAVALATLPPLALASTVIGSLTGLVVALLVGWGLVVVGRTAARTPASVADGPALSLGSAAAVPLVGPDPAPPELEPLELESPTWSPDAAAGAVWRTAGEAARGAPASSWGGPGRETSPDTGWTPYRQESAAEPDERADPDRTAPADDR